LPRLENPHKMDVDGSRLLAPLPVSLDTSSTYTWKIE
jgi:hypothetical protein